MSAGALAEAATHWAFVYPAGWWPIPLDDPNRIDERVRAVVVDRLGRRDDRVRARRDAREHLSKAAHEAADRGALSLTVFSMDVADTAVTGSMVVVPHAVAPGSSRDELLAELVSSVSGADVERYTADDGWVLRAVRETEVERTDGDGSPVLPELWADYWTERDGLDTLLRVSFTTPFVPLRAGLVELFDAVVLSLHPVVRG